MSLLTTHNLGLEVSNKDFWKVKGSHYLELCCSDHSRHLFILLLTFSPIQQTCSRRLSQNIEKMLLLKVQLFNWVENIVAKREVTHYEQRTNVGFQKVKQSSCLLFFFFFFFILFSTLFKLGHGDSSPIHDSWVNKPVWQGNVPCRRALHHDRRVETSGRTREAWFQIPTMHMM